MVFDPAQLAASRTDGTNFSSPTAKMYFIPVEVIVPMVAAIVPPSNPDVITPTFPSVSTAFPPLINTVSRWKSSNTSGTVFFTSFPLWRTTGIRSSRSSAQVTHSIPFVLIPAVKL